MRKRTVLCVALAVVWFVQLAAVAQAAPLPNLVLTCSDEDAIGQPQNSCGGIWAYEIPTNDLIVLSGSFSSNFWFRASDLAGSDSLVICTLPAEPGTYSSCRDQADVRRTAFVPKDTVIDPLHFRPLEEVTKLEDVESTFGNNRFGLAVALSTDGRTALVGARGDGEPGLSAAGSAFVYRLIQGRWVQEAKLVPPTRILEGSYGVSVALSANGDIALIGASAFFANCMQLVCGGAAYFYGRDPDGEWMLLQSVTSPDGGFSDAFGSSVALSASGRIAIIGAERAERAGCDPGAWCGAAFVFERGKRSWQRHDRLSPAIPDPFVARFGFAASVSLSGNTVLIGAENAAYIFSREADSWIEERRFDGVGYAFGRSVALSGNGRIAIVGAAGEAYAFLRSQHLWGKALRLPVDRLGPTDVAVAISATGNRVLLGASPSRGCPSINNCIGITLEREDHLWVQREILRSRDSTTGDNSFGDTVSLSAAGQRALIGGAFQACLSNPSVCNGAAYIFEAQRLRH